MDNLCSLFDSLTVNGEGHDEWSMSGAGWETPDLGTADPWQPQVAVVYRVTPCLDCGTPVETAWPEEVTIKCSFCTFKDCKKGRSISSLNEECGCVVNTQPRRTVKARR